MDNNGVKNLRFKDFILGYAYVFIEILLSDG